MEHRQVEQLSASAVRIAQLAEDLVRLISDEIAATQGGPPPSTEPDREPGERLLERQARE